MLKQALGIFSGLFLIALMCACESQEVDPDIVVSEMPHIYPDYTEVTVAPNLVSPRFWVQDTCDLEAVQGVFTAEGIKYVVDGKGRKISLSEAQWADLCEASETVNVQIYSKKDGKWTAFAPFNIYVAPDSIDKFIAFRLIEPGYESWNEMGIYQRCLESFRRDPIITNSQTDYGCMNCHSFCMQNPQKWLMHLRVEHGGTYLIDGDEITKLNTKTPETISALVYPSWHPSGDFVAFSVNDTKQMFHTTDKNRIEVYDNASDVVVYDVKKHEIVSSPLLKSDEFFATFPTFSPDGRTLYFCSAKAQPMPEKYDSLYYNICSIAFDPATRTFGTEVDTLYNADLERKSASFPRVSPDGRYLMFTKSAYGNFSIWHRDADLYMIDLADGEISPIDVFNSPETESYHSWSSNGRWVVFSSRRLDGLYTRPYIGYIDREGKAHKPLLLPQDTEDYYDLMMKSFNVPEFIKKPVLTTGYEISQKAKNDPGIDVKYSR